MDKIWARLCLNLFLLELPFIQLMSYGKAINVGDTLPLGVSLTG